MGIAVAMAGTGDWARTGLGPALREIPGVTLAACASPDGQQARQFAAELGVHRVYPGVEDMLAGETGIGLLVVATPDDHHPAAIDAAIAAGVPVFCEKPLANSGAEADRLAAAVERAALTATVGYSFRYSTAVQQLRSDVRAGLLGTPWLLELHEHNPQFHPVIGRPLTWKGDPGHAAGGAVLEYGAHIVDLGCWLLGPASRVAANYATVVPGAVLDDIATLQLRYSSGAMGTVVASWVLGGGWPGIRLHLHGSGGSASVRLGNREDGTERYTRYAPSGEMVSDTGLVPGRAGHASYVARQLTDFLMVLSGEPPRYAETLPTLRSAAHVQHVLDAALGGTDAGLAVSGAAEQPAPEAAAPLPPG